MHRTPAHTNEKYIAFFPYPLVNRMNMGNAAMTPDICKQPARPIAPRIRRCDIDSSILGVPVSRILPRRLRTDELSELIGQGKRHDAALIYWGACESFSRRDDIVLHGYTGRCCGVNRSLSLRLAAPSVPEARPLPSVSLFTGPASTVELDHLALECSRHSHLRNDSLISPSQADQLYRLWMHNSLAGREADAVFVTGEDKRFTGMATCVMRGRMAVIGLIAVENQSRRKGLGTALVRAVKEHARSSGCSLLTVVTQENNNAALQFYRHCGFSSGLSSYMYHFWRT
jgi:ribosomal protein S18 acetylase RimI-like enzyme